MGCHSNTSPFASLSFVSKDKWAEGREDDTCYGGFVDIVHSFPGCLAIAAYVLILVFSVLVICNFNKGLMSKGVCVCVCVCVCVGD